MGGQVFRAGFRNLLMAAVGGLAMVASAAAAPTKLTIGYSPLLDALTAFVAKDEGFFAKHDLDVTLVSVTLNSNVPAAIVAGSLDVGCVNATVFLQAVDGGLDFQIVDGATKLPNKDAIMAYVTRPDVPFTGVKGLEGKKIAMPGIGASVDILFQKWMADQGADPKKVNYVELSSSQVPDVMRSKSVDGAVVVEPFLSRAVKSGSAQIVHRLTDGYPGEILAISYIAQREWVAKNHDTLEKMRAAFRDADSWTEAHPDQARTLLTTYLKLPKEVADGLPMPIWEEKVTPADLTFWIDAMAAQGRLTSKPDPAKLIAP